MGGSPANGIAPVGTAASGAGAFGQLDLAGELLEWTADWYSPSYVSPCQDCAYLTQTPQFERVVRGGAWTTSLLADLMPTYRDSSTPTGRLDGVGFRCARP
jgi:formylglycine-generating enzyme required for sulfatase activity